MSPVFRHGRLRLYLLKLLDESPRHGYEVIRLLQDRFMGVYAPSPGTIYPRLARRPRDDAWREAAQGAGDAERDRQHEHEGPDRNRWHEHAGRHWGYKDWGDWASWSGWAGPHDCPDPGAYRDLERLAKQFSRDLRHAAWQAQAVSEDAVRDLRGILDETIDRIKAEVFGAKAASQQPGGPDDTEAGPTDTTGE